MNVQNTGHRSLAKMADRVEEEPMEEYDLAMAKVLQHLGVDPYIVKRELLKDHSVGGVVHHPAKE